MVQYIRYVIEKKDDLRRIAMIIKGNVYQNGSFHDNLDMNLPGKMKGEVLDFSNMLVMK